MTPYQTARYICWAFSCLEQTNGEIAWQRDVLLHQRKVVYRCKVLKKMCCSDLETLFINCEPFYSVREFCSFILVSVYIPPQAHVSLALQKLADLITDTEQQHPDSVLIILGDFNIADLSCELPKYKQHVTCPTRDSNILDHCYTAIKDAYHGQL